MGSWICTGPGRAPLNNAKASAMTLGNDSGCQMVLLISATLLTIPCWSCNSCKCPSPLPVYCTLLTLDITSIGIESANDCAIAVMILVMPGPVIIKHTPTLQEAR